MAMMRIWGLVLDVERISFESMQFNHDYKERKEEGEETMGIVAFEDRDICLVYTLRKYVGVEEGCRSKE